MTRLRILGRTPWLGIVWPRPSERVGVKSSCTLGAVRVMTTTFMSCEDVRPQHRNEATWLMFLPAAQAAGTKEYKTISLRGGRDRRGETRTKRDPVGTGRQWGTETAASIPIPLPPPPSFTPPTAEQWHLPPPHSRLKPALSRTNLPQLAAAGAAQPSPAGRANHPRHESGSWPWCWPRSSVWGAAPEQIRVATLPAPAVSRQGPEVVRV